MPLVHFPVVLENISSMRWSEKDREREEERETNRGRLSGIRRMDKLNPHNCMFCVRCHFPEWKLNAKRNTKFSFHVRGRFIRHSRQPGRRTSKKMRQINPFEIYCNDLIISFASEGVLPLCVHCRARCSSVSSHKLQCVIAVIIGLAYCGYENHAQFTHSAHTTSPIRQWKEQPTTDPTRKKVKINK